MGDGAASYLSLKLGEGNSKSAAKGVGNALTMLCISGISMLVIGVLFIKQLAILFGATELILPYALDYGKIIVIGLPFVIISTGLNSIIRADGSPKFAMFSMLLGALINVVLDPVFIFTFHMGVKGAALATILGQIASLIVTLFYIRKFKNITLDKNSFNIEWSIARVVLGYGISSFITQIAITIVMGVMNNVLKIYGEISIYGAEIPLTALGIVMKVNQILISIIVGIAVGAQPIIGYNFGAGNYKRVKKALGIAIILSTIVTVLAALLFQLIPQSIVNIFGSEEGLYNEFAVKCFRIFLLFCILNGFQTVSGIFLQAIGKPLKSAVVSLSRQIVFLIPAVIILPKFWGVVGVLWAGPVADGLTFVLSVIIIVYEMKKINKLEKLYN
ncbi:MAG: MATE family efflux transporter [Velocimicrobium sp.]